MDQAKVYQRKAAVDMDQPGKVDKTKPVKKSSQQPAKGKRSDGVKRTVKKREDSGPPWWERTRQYLREVSYELRKVVWPSRKETIGTTSVVLMLVLLSSVYLGIVDLILSRFIRLLLG